MKLLSLDFYRIYFSFVLARWRVISVCYELLITGTRVARKMEKVENNLRNKILLTIQLEKKKNYN